ncbi:uncharacterized protein LY79DRAFT_119401 [Colletotrichum navitas]|uniref:Uncharacterized protein n=1 Tax=Colletotrichum navitas TaxID=681940 RepID=A0AAD8Q382_9PEZI|nr:uncharacterized protein LY79DRAFT_119401 [Colletotrichum navitas]KAK1595117.1 hypothetical protein LY79DRAFT_119401 [Colletotrichum navitas]
MSALTEKEDRSSGDHPAWQARSGPLETLKKPGPSRQSKAKKSRAVFGVVYASLVRHRLRAQSSECTHSPRRQHATPRSGRARFANVSNLDARIRVNHHQSVGAVPCRAVPCRAELCSAIPSVDDACRAMRRVRRAFERTLSGLSLQTSQRGGTESKRVVWSSPRAGIRQVVD